MAGVIDSYMRPIMKKLPCIVIDDESDPTYIGILRDIERIDNIDYYFYYEEVVIFSKHSVDVKKNHNVIQSYNHLDSMHTANDSENLNIFRLCIKFLFNGVYE